ncbi:hypothetical protein CVT24_002607 [Panaeolus cyanescens]|uniref:Nephrocystin 3-like N-terminal domain-containing protein n=1 Tax=Panaeolus cyanescens TaxID=181874 RepID=A0A409YTV0_9AGAR|nr:hypothetical protein CVT24_002607 [Panaeolus cyanescens]
MGDQLSPIHHGHDHNKVVVSNLLVTNHIQNMTQTGKPGLHVLADHTASGASYDSKERYDEPRCHPETRKSRTTPHYDDVISPLHLPTFHMIRPYVESFVDNNPSFFDLNLQKQLDGLIVRPLKESKRTSPLVLVIDGLDECQDSAIQLYILRSFVRIFSEIPLIPLRILVSCRPEPHILDYLKENQENRALTCLDLYNVSDSQADITLYVKCRFETIRLKRRIQSHWPEICDIHRLVGYCGGSFILASVVLDYLEGSSGDVEKRFRGVLMVISRKGHANPENPLAALDSMFWAWSRHDLESYVKALASVVHPKTLHTYHATFLDFLMDKTRSGDYFLDIDEVTIKYVRQYLKLSTEKPSSETRREFSARLFGPSYLYDTLSLKQLAQIIVTRGPRTYSNKSALDHPLLPDLQRFVLSCQYGDLWDLRDYKPGSESHASTPLCWDICDILCDPACDSIRDVCFRHLSSTLAKSLENPPARLIWEWSDLTWYCYGTPWRGPSRASPKQIATWICDMGWGYNVPLFNSQKADRLVRESGYNARMVFVGSLDKSSYVQCIRPHHGSGFVDLFRRNFNICIRYFGDENYLSYPEDCSKPGTRRWYAARFLYL